MSAQAAKVLRDAAGVIAQRGHHKRNFCSDLSDGTVGAVCLWGGINAALSGDAMSYVVDLCDGPSLSPAQMAEANRRATVRNEIRGHLAAQLDDHTVWPGAENFNDLPETTSEDVQKVLLRVADEIEFS